MANCKIAGCDNEADYPIVGVCKTCYSGLRYWQGRGVRDKRHRLKQIERLQGRMEYMLVGDLPKKSNVVAHTRRRKK